MSIKANCDEPVNNYINEVIFGDEYFDPELTLEQERLAENIAIAAAKVKSKQGLLTTFFLPITVAKQMALYLEEEAP